MARQFATTERQRGTMVRLAEDGHRAAAIAQAMGLNADTVMNTVRRVLPNAFRRTKVEFKPANDTVRCRMPFDMSWSTDPRTHHSITLPRLKCLEDAA